MRRVDQLHQRRCQLSTGLGIAAASHTGRGSRLHPCRTQTSYKRSRPPVAIPRKTARDHRLLAMVTEEVAVRIMVRPERPAHGVAADMKFQTGTRIGQPRGQAVAQKTRRQAPYVDASAQRPHQRVWPWIRANGRNLPAMRGGPLAPTTPSAPPTSRAETPSTSLSLSLTLRAEARVDRCERAKSWREEASFAPITGRLTREPIC
jgi:hypothetical protein